MKLFMKQYVYRQQYVEVDQRIIMLNKSFLKVLNFGFIIKIVRKLRFMKTKKKMENYDNQ